MFVVSLDCLDRGRFGDGKAGGQGGKARDWGVGEGRELADARLGGQCQQPFHLDPHARLEKAVFGEDRPQRIDLGGVAAVERGQGEQLRFDGHGGVAWRKPRILLRLPGRTTGISSPSPPRSEDRRVGTEGCRTCSTRWSPEFSKKKKL